MSIAAYDVVRHLTSRRPDFDPVYHVASKFQGGEVDVTPARLNTKEHLIVLQGAEAEDLLLMAMLVDALRRQYDDIKLYAYIPYLPGARADLVGDRPLGAKVYADFINSMGFDKVFCIDPHSEVAPSHYNNVSKIEVADFICWNRPNNVTAVVAPDAGAAKRAAKVAEAIGVPLFLGSKRRDHLSMELSDFAPIAGLPRAGTILVVDDICDGGRTFLGLADVLDLDRERMALWTTHAVYSYNAPARLDQSYGWLGCTDSHPGHIALNDFNGDYRVAPILEILQDHLEEK